MGERGGRGYGLVWAGGRAGGRAGACVRARLCARVVLCAVFVCACTNDDADSWCTCCPRLPQCPNTAGHKQRENNDSLTLQARTEMHRIPLAGIPHTRLPPSGRGETWAGEGVRSTAALQGAWRCYSAPVKGIIRQWEGCVCGGGGGQCGLRVEYPGSKTVFSLTRAISSLPPKKPA